MCVVLVGQLISICGVSPHSVVVGDIPKLIILFDAVYLLLVVCVSVYSLGYHENLAANWISCIHLYISQFQVGVTPVT